MPQLKRKDYMVWKQWIVQDYRFLKIKPVNWQKFIDVLEVHITSTFRVEKWRWLLWYCMTSYPRKRDSVWLCAWETAVSHIKILYSILLSVTSPLCSMNKYIDTIISQNTTQFYAQYVQYISQLHVSAETCSCETYCTYCA